MLVVHRPRYSDWTFPKGKVDDGESLAEAALREVVEETGYHCGLGSEIGVVEYTATALAAASSFTTSP